MLEAMALNDDKIDFRFQVGSLGYRLHVRRDRHRGGYEALLLTDDGGPLMMPNGTSPSDAIARLVRELTAGDAFDRKIARVIVQRSGFPSQLKTKSAHATKAEELFVLEAIHNGTDWGVRRATRAEAAEEHRHHEGWAMPYAQAVEGAKENAKRYKCKWFDFSGDPAPKSGSRAHATKRAIPGVTKWNMFAGGAAEGKHSYSLRVSEGEYHIMPYTTRNGRHAGYLLKFAGTHGRPRGSHGGLWHDLGSHASPQKAASAAAAHYAKGFE